MCAAEQKEAFQSALTESLSDACSLELVQTIYDRFREKIDAHKESRDPEPLSVTANDVAAILQDSGIEEDKTSVFLQQCSDRFGEHSVLMPSNLIEHSHFEVKTSDATIAVAPERSYMLEVRVIDGRRYLMIPADEDVEINGFPVHVQSKQ